MIRFRIVEGANEEVEELMHDTMSSLYTVLYSLSSLLSPIVGGAFYDWIGYKKTTFVMSCFLLFLALFYLFFNAGCSVLKDTRKEKQALEELQNANDE